MDVNGKYERELPYFLFTRSEDESVADSTTSTVQLLTADCSCGPHRICAEVGIGAFSSYEIPDIKTIKAGALVFAPFAFHIFSTMNQVN